METAPDTMLAAALEYAQRGWRVLPLHNPLASGCSCTDPTCSKIGKHPRISNWTELASSAEFTIRKYWRQWPSANIGMLTGKDSGIFVLDVDGDAGRDSLSKLEAQHGALPVTLTARSGRGQHYYFKYPGIPVKSCAARRPGLDVRGDGAYIIAPPSLHPNGKRYEWLNEGVAIAEAPEWLLAIVTEKKLPEPVATSASPSSVPEGQRNDTMFARAVALHNQGMSKNEVLKSVSAFNLYDCKPPMEEAEVRSIVDSATKNPPNRTDKQSGKFPLWWRGDNVQAFLADSELCGLTDYQTGWYYRILSYAWLRAGVLDGDLDYLVRLLRPDDVATFKREIEQCLPKFGFVRDKLCGADILINPTMVLEHAKSMDVWLGRVERGKAEKSPRKRKAKPIPIKVLIEEKKAA